MAFLDSDFAQLPDIISQPLPQPAGDDARMQEYFGQPSPFTPLAEYLMNRPVFKRGARLDSPMDAFQYGDAVGDSVTNMRGQQSAIQQQFEALMQMAQEERAAQEAERQALMDRISVLEGRPQQPAIDLDALRRQIREEVMAGLPSRGMADVERPVPVAALPEPRRRSVPTRKIARRGAPQSMPSRARRIEAPPVTRRPLPPRPVMQGGAPASRLSGIASASLPTELRKRLMRGAGMRGMI